MSRPSVLIVLVAVLGAAAAATAFAAVGRARAQRRQQAAPVARTTTTVARSVDQAPPLRPVPAPPRPAAPSFSVAAVKPGRTIALRAKPNGRVVARVDSSTEFGSGTVLAVATTHGDWLGVTSTALPNGAVAWVKSSDALQLHRTKVSIRVDLSKRRLELRDGSSTVRSFKVAIGRPGSPTPLGRYAITDKLSGSQYGPYYGCCILALSGHQPHTPPGWQGGNRLAIHGTDSQSTVGTPASAGCLRASDANLRVLMRRVPVGTPVFIRA
jgi:lipoprotein-anchoring transpeptidase ErfK/SrfK